jgi:hypothetical protein
MDEGIYELVEKIWRGVSFIAFGGAAVIIFFFIFAPSILGSKSIHKQLDNLGRQIEEMNKQLKQIAGSLKKDKEDKKKER